jgi:hypothetical protein
LANSEDLTSIIHYVSHTHAHACYSLDGYFVRGCTGLGLAEARSSPATGRGSPAPLMRL